MSIVKLRRTVRKQIKLRVFGRTFEVGSAMAWVFWLIVIIFVVGTYYMYGPGDGGGGPRQQGVGRKVGRIVAKLDGHNITRAEYEGHLYRMTRGRGQDDLAQQRHIKKDVLDGIIQGRLMLAAAQAAGISLSRADIEQKKDQLVEATLQYQYSEKAQLRKILQDRDMSLEEFKRELRTRRFADDDALREQLLFEKLQESVQRRAQLTDQELKDSYTEVKARHILVDPETLAEEMKAEREKQKQASSDKAGEAAEQATSKEPTQEPSEAELEEAAKKKLAQIRKQIVEGDTDFAEMAKEHSHCPSADRGGDLGWFKRGQMAKEFEEAAFKLKPGQVSEVVKTKFGLHLIKVEDIRQELPEDFEEKKPQYKAQVMQQRRQQAWRQYQEQLRERAKVEILDPELLAYDLLGKDPAKHAAQAAQLLVAATKTDPLNDSARYELAMLYQQAGETEKAIGELTELAQSERAAASPQVHLRLGEMLKHQGKTEEAVAQLSSASEWAAGFEYSNYFLHMRLKDLFEEMDEKDLAQKEQEWVDDFSEQQSRTEPGTFTVE